jgi:hypothetical protein
VSGVILRGSIVPRMALLVILLRTGAGDALVASPGRPGALKLKIRSRHGNLVSEGSEGRGFVIPYLSRGLPSCLRSPAERIYVRNTYYYCMSSLSRETPSALEHVLSSVVPSASCRLRDCTGIPL